MSRCKVFFLYVLHTKYMQVHRALTQSMGKQFYIVGLSWQHVTEVCVARGEKFDK